MKEIVCETSNCEHNLKCRCLAGIVSIGGTAKCQSKIKREGGSLAQAFADIEAGDDAFDNVPDLVVQCDADCAFNSGGICTNERIEVTDGILSTKCRTREKTK